MFHITITIGILALTYPTVSAADVFQAGEYRSKSGGNLPYRYLIPENAKNPQERFPLVIFFCGHDQAGRDNERQLARGIRRFSEIDVMRNFPCFVIAPQCHDKWVAVNWAESKSHILPKAPSESMALTVELMDEFCSTHQVDTDRIYLVGLSMGGFAVFDLMTREAGRFAAAIEIAGGAPEGIASFAKTTPVWVFHNENDSIVPTSRADQAVKDLSEAKCQVRYTRYPKPPAPQWDHDAWTRAFMEPDFFSWLFANKKLSK